MEELINCLNNNGLAIYGAVLSTGMFLWNIWKSRPKIQIEVVYNSPAGVMVSIQNPSNYTVHITSVSFLKSTGPISIKAYLLHLFKYKRFPSTLGWSFVSLSFKGVNIDCPKSIEPGRAHRIPISEEVIHELLSNSDSKNFKISVQDELWKNTYSSKFHYEF